MQRETKEISMALGGHLTIGLVLGAVFALVLPLCSDLTIFALIRSGPSPRLVMAMYIGVFAMTFGIGATLTGLVLEMTEEHGE